MRSPSMIRWGALAAVLGGMIWVAKGSLIILGGPDLGDLLIFAELFFALALVTLYFHLDGRGGRPGKIGGLLACVAVALSILNAPYALIFAQDAPQTPFPFNIMILVASLAIFFGLVSLGVATLRAGTLPTPWKFVPLAIGVVAILPVWILALVHVELPVVVLGAGWILLGYVLYSGAGSPTRQRSRAG